MKKNVFISSLFTPIQPTLQGSVAAVFYEEFKPDIRLSPYIHCYWQLKSREKLASDFNYKVVADGCMDVYFELHNPSDSYITGFSQKYTEFPLGTSFHYIGVRFYPGMFPLLFSVKASELTNRCEALDLIIPEKADYIKRYFNTDSDTEAIKTLFDHFYLNWLTHSVVKPDFRFLNAIALIHQNAGKLNVETDIDTGISPRQLRRLFEFYIGDSAKTFCKVVRFQNVLRHTTALNNTNSAIYLDYGYYDQAHFIREFKTMYGTSPGTVFKNK